MIQSIHFFLVIGYTRSMSEFVKHLSNSLFWDVDINEIDDEKNKGPLCNVYLKEKLTMIGNSLTKSTPYKQ